MTSSHHHTHMTSSHLMTSSHKFWHLELVILNHRICSNSAQIATNLVICEYKIISVLYDVFGITSPIKKPKFSGKKNFDLFVSSKGMQKPKLNHLIPFILWCRKFKWYCCEYDGSVEKHFSKHYPRKIKKMCKKKHKRCKKWLWWRHRDIMITSEPNF